MNLPADNLQPVGLQLGTHHLQYLVAVAGADTAAEAASELGVTPSALSQGLAELERRLGLSLFEREGRGRRLSPHGEQAVDYARRILSLTVDMARWANVAKVGRTGRVHVGMTDVAAVHHFADALTRFRADRPEVDFMLTAAPSGPLLEQLQSGRLDAAVVVEPPQPIDGVSTVAVLTEQLAVYPPHGTRVGEPATWGPWVAFPSSSHTRRLVAARLRSVGADYRVIAESHQPEVLRRLVALGIGWTVLPVVQAEAEPSPLRRAVGTPTFDRTLVLARRSRSTDGPALRALFELMGVPDRGPSRV
jgi:DNA-binding transcriptional LysR family regulator